MKRICFIRHAQCDMNLTLATHVGGQSNGSPLTPLGKQQASSKLFGAANGLPGADGGRTGALCAHAAAYAHVCMHATQQCAHLITPPASRAPCVRVLWGGDRRRRACARTCTSQAQLCKARAGAC